MVEPVVFVARTADGECSPQSEATPSGGATQGLFGVGSAAAVHS
jgi:hypothetical protein